MTNASKVVKMCIKLNINGCIVCQHVFFHAIIYVVQLVAVQYGSRLPKDF